MGQRIFQGEEKKKIEKQKTEECYMKMHSTGKTEQAKADLDRLAIMMEEAARKKRKARDDTTLSGVKMLLFSLTW